MATITDQLITVLRLTGAREYAHGLHQAAQAVDKLSGAHKKAAAKAGGVGGGGGAAGGGTGGKGGGGGGAGILANILGDVTPELAAAAGLVALVGFSLRAFGEAEQSIFRTTVALKNLGSSLDIKEVQGFATQMQTLTGINDEAVIATVGLLKRFGATDAQVKDLTKTVADFSAGTGISMEHAGTAVGHALIGNARMLRNLGVEFKATGDRAKDFAAIQEKLSDLFGGAAEAHRNTLGGAFEGLMNAFGDLFEAVGSKLATIVVPIVHILTQAIQLWAQHVTIFTTTVGALAGLVFGGPIGALIGGIAGLGIGLLPDKANAAAGIGNGQSKLATEDTLNKIEKNTSKLNESLISQVLGGPGTVANVAGNWRDMALGLRA